MAIEVFSVGSIVEGEIVLGTLPTKASLRIGDVAAMLTNLPAVEATECPALTLIVWIKQRSVAVPIQRLNDALYRASREQPVELQSALWFFRDGFYVAERQPKPSEVEEVTLRIKALHFQRDGAMRRLREQVANFEAIETNLKGGAARRAIPDDVKLAVWARDGGACVSCRAAKQLQFDHIIPVAKGGSDGAENIQLLCRTCNLAKSDRIGRG